MFCWFSFYHCMYGCMLCVLLFNSASYVLFLCLCILIVMFFSVYSVFIVPTGTLRLPWLRFFRAFPSVVRQMPGYNSQRLGTASTLPKLIVSFCVLFVCKCVLYYCHRLATQLQLNISYQMKLMINLHLARWVRTSGSIPPLPQETVLRYTTNEVQERLYVYVCVCEIVEACLTEQYWGG
jgi:hypothetical protein